jgi:glutathione S-transferase
MSRLPLKLVGAPGSPYSRKLRSALRYRRIPYVWIQHGSKDAADVPPPPVALLPVVVFPGNDGSYAESAIDTTPLLHRLEHQYDGRSIVPPQPALAFLDALIEDYADEWLTKCMFHYRWAFAADAEFAGRILPRWSAIDASDERIAPLSAAFSKRQIDRLWVVGSNRTTAPVIEASYERLLRLLGEHLERSPFIFGRRPACADFALFGQLTQLVQFDPTSMAIARAQAPRIVAWVDVVEDLSGLVVSEGDWLVWDASDGLPPTLRALLAEVGRVYAPFMTANALALESGTERVECEIDGRAWVQKPFPYQGKCLRVLRERYAALKPGDRAIVDRALEGTGCAALVR